MKKTKNMYIKETAESRELTIFIENNADLYTRYILPICKNLSRHFKRGNYSREKAIRPARVSIVKLLQIYATFNIYSTLPHVIRQRQNLKKVS